MRSLRPIAALALALLAALLSRVAAAESMLESRLRARLEAGLVTDSLSVLDERLYARETLRLVYADRAYAPLWVTENGLTEAGLRLADWLPTGPVRHGLRAADYHARALRALRGSMDVGALVDTELALSDAFLTIASHLLAGRLDPRTLDPQWVAARRERDLVPYLVRAAGSSAPDGVLAELLPREKGYGILVDLLAALRRERDAAGWPTVSPGPTLHLGDAGQRVTSLAQRLAASGDLPLTAAEASTFDSDLASGVKRFQARHGLTPDGVVGPATLRALNVPIQSRIDQIIVNLERWRWLPEDLGERYVIVNIAGFELQVVDHDETQLAMKVVVGTTYRRTPVFSGRISYIVFNPSWEVPPSIAVKDKLPLIKANPGYLAEQNFTLLQGWGADERVVDPATVDWSRITARSFPFRLRQAPGPGNALGQIKFMFPNPFSVYLHDTPSRELFARESRSFSSGCIRLENPPALAEYLLQDAGWDADAVAAAVRAGREQTVRLKTAVPVHLLYWTTWVDADGMVQFRDDVYGRDKAVMDELRETPPQPDDL